MKGTGLQKRNCTDISIEITVDIIENKVDLILGVEIYRVSSAGVMSTMGVNVCHHGEGGDVVQAPSQHLLGVQVFHQRAWHRKFRKIQKDSCSDFLPSHLLGVLAEVEGGHGVVLNAPQEVVQIDQMRIRLPEWISEIKRVKIKTT